MKRMALLLALGLAWPALGEESGRVGARVPSVDFGHWFGALLIVLAAILLLAWLVRRMGPYSAIPLERFRVLASLPLSARERVVLLQVGDRQLVLGVTPGQVQTLFVLQANETISASASNGVSEAPAFTQVLQQFLHRGKP
jgi:flagellar protein FliO/FliZ